MDGKEPLLADYGLSRNMEEYNSLVFSQVGSPITYVVNTIIYPLYMIIEINNLSIVLLIILCFIILRMAPELMKGEQATCKVDVYSFGCLITDVISLCRCWSDYKYVSHEKVWISEDFFLLFNMIKLIISSMKM